MAISPPVSQGARIAGMVARKEDPEKIEAARAELAALKIEQFVERTLAEAPPIPLKRRKSLARLLTGAGE